MSWPPNPHSKPNSPVNNPPTPLTDAHLMREVLLATVTEQQRARRWNNFFRLVSLALTLLVLGSLARSCSHADKKTMPLDSTMPHLAVVNIEGEIGSKRGGVESDDVIKAINKAFAAEQSKAVVLNINSPGGSPVQSDDIWQDIRYQRTRFPDKKVYAVIGDLGASGAYYIASAADEIWVNPSSLVGSIGVIMPNYGVTELAKKLGVEDRTLTAGAHKAILSPTRPLDALEKVHVQGVLDNVHSHFINAVKTGRGNRLKADTPDLFSGLFWSGEQAITVGLADKTGNIDSLGRSLKIDKKVDYTIEHSPLETLFGKMGTQFGQTIGSAMSQQLQTQLLGHSLPDNRDLPLK